MRSGLRTCIALGKRWDMAWWAQVSGLDSSKASIGMRLELGGWVMGRGAASWGQGFNFHWGGAWPQGLSSVGGGASWRWDLDGVGLGEDLGQTCP